jgi:hypothetical protein
MQRTSALIERRSVLIPLATIIGVISAFMLWIALQNAYLDYWYYPKAKSADPGLYIYPELRYTIFDSLLILWCTDGLVASILSFRCARLSRGISRWTQRTLVLYFVLFAVLILGGILMMVARSHGY